MNHNSPPSLFEILVVVCARERSSSPLKCSDHLLLTGMLEFDSDCSIGSRILVSLDTTSSLGFGVSVEHYIET